MKKFLSIILTLAMILTIIPANSLRVNAESSGYVTITYHANGEGATVNGVSDYAKQYDADQYLDLDVTPDPRPGYYFDHWSTQPVDENGEHRVYYLDTHEGAYPTDIYAIWGKTTTITYDANGGYFNSDPSSTIFTEDLPYGGYIGSNFTMERPGYMFMGWSRSKDAEFGDGDLNMNFFDEPITLYATWAAAWTVTIRYNDKSVEYQIFRGYDVLIDDLLELQLEIPEGYGIRALALDPEGENIVVTDYNQYLTYAPDSDVTLYVVLGKRGRVHLHGNGGFFHENPSETDFDYAEGWYDPSNLRDHTFVGEIRYNKELELPLREDYFFAGWSTDPNATEPDSDHVVIEEGMDLYAVWTKQLSVVYHKGDGEFTGDYAGQDTVTVTYEAGTEVPALADIYRYGYNFEGWSEIPADRGDGYGYDYYYQQSIGSDRVLNLYPVWKKMFPVTFHANREGATVLGRTDYVINYDFYFHETYLIEPDMNNHFRFLFWSTQPDDTEGRYKVTEFYTDPETCPTDLYAIYQDTVNISLIGNGGYYKSVFGNMISSYVTLDKGDSYDLKDAPVPERDGYDFQGYSYSSQGGEILGTITPAEDVILYAVWKKAGETQPIFTDVQDPKHPFYKAIYWAYENNITAGTTPTTFGPNENCTRGQVVTFLWRAAGKPEPKTTTNPFTDVKTTSPFYKAILWASEEGITAGLGDGRFGVSDTCTRGQIVTFLWRYAHEPASQTTVNPFTDVKTTSPFYKAILWAYDTNITKGINAIQFAPNNTCTRGQVVTFLYRLVVENGLGR